MHIYAGLEQIIPIRMVKEIKAKGRTKRHQSLSKDLLEGKEGGIRPRGKPISNWKGNMKT